MSVPIFVIVIKRNTLYKQIDGVIQQYRIVNKTINNYNCLFARLLV